MTEWEREKEREDFARASVLFRPLSTMMASRFTSAKFADNQKNVELAKGDANVSVLDVPLEMPLNKSI